MKRLSLTLLALLGLLAWGPTPASAVCSVNTVPQVGVICDVTRNFTYAAASVGLVPASSATDIFCISGSTTKTISVREITLSGTAGTAITTPVLLYRRVSLDTGGTAATGAALPVGAPLITTNPTVTAVLTAYTANPTINDSSPVLLGAPAVSFSVTTGTNSPFVWNAGSQVDIQSQGFDIVKGTAQQLCLNLNGVSISSGVLAIGIKWQES
jgi:hypothetical protein